MSIDATDSTGDLFVTGDCLTDISGINVKDCSDGWFKLDSRDVYKKLSVYLQQMSQNLVSL